MGGIPSGSKAKKNDEKLNFMRELAAVSQGQTVKKYNYAEETAAIDAELDSLLEDFSSSRGGVIAPLRGGGTPKGAAALRAAADNMSRRSTEQGTPGSETGPKVTSMRTNSARRSQKFLQEAKQEVITMSLNPNKNKKKKPTRLEPLDDNKPKHRPKITGNYASDVLADLAEREKNRGHGAAIRKLNKEMKTVMKDLGAYDDVNKIAS